MKVQLQEVVRSLIVACKYEGHNDKWVLADDKEELWLYNNDGFHAYALNVHVHRGCAWEKDKTGFLAKVIIKKDEYNFAISEYLEQWQTGVT